MLWGKLLAEMNQLIARFGGRLSINSELTPEQVELWVDSKKARAAEGFVLYLGSVLRQRRAKQPHPVRGHLQ